MLRVRPAAAEVAHQRFFDFIYGRNGVLVQEGLGGDYEAGSTKTALHAAMFNISFDEGMASPGNPFNSLDGFPVTFYGEGHTGKNRPSLYDDGTGAACAFSTKLFGPRHPEQLRDYILEGPVGLHFEFMGIAVDQQVYDAF